MELRAAGIIDADIEAHFARYDFVEQISTREHKHDFFEMFLISKGSIYHHINGQKILLEVGSMVFIRPDDAHYFQQYANENCQLINLAYLRRTFDAVGEYLGLAQDSFFQPELPPSVILNPQETAVIGSRLKDWGRIMYKDKSRSRTALRALLAQIITDFFVVRIDDFSEDTPWWLVELCQKMRKKQHIVEGREALIRLANRTPEHLGRVFKSHLSVTPSEFVNNLRLDYASELLLNTDQSATQICYEVGFENISHFYRLFKQRWDCSPLEFRKQNRRVLIP